MAAVAGETGGDVRKRFGAEERVPRRLRASKDDRPRRFGVEGRASSALGREEANVRKRFGAEGRSGSAARCGRNPDGGASASADGPGSGASRGQETGGKRREPLTVGSSSALGRVKAKARKRFGAEGRPGRGASRGRDRETALRRRLRNPEAVQAAEGPARRRFGVGSGTRRRRKATTGPSEAARAADGGSSGSVSQRGTAADEPVNGGNRSSGTRLRSSDLGCGTRRAAHAAVRVQV